MSEGTPLNYQTQAAQPVVTAVPGLLRAEPEAERQTPAPQPGEAEASGALESGLTRRELRALREAQEAANRPAPALIEPEQPTTHTLADVPISRIAENVVPEVPLRPAAVSPVAPVAPARAAASPFAGAPLTPAAPSAGSAPVSPVEPRPVVIPTAAIAPTVIPAATAIPATHVIPAAEAAAVRSQPTAEFLAPQASAAAIAAQPAPSAVDQFEQLIHDGGGSNHTANALVLPTIPTHADLPRSLDGTGEILITGSMDLTRGYGAVSGQRPALDGIEIDRLIEAEDHEIGTTDSIPVRATNAISTHTQTRGVIQAKRPRGGNKMLTVLAITASVMAVVVVGLVVVGFVSGIF